MFTGIVTDIGTVIASEQRGDRRVVVRCGYDLAGVAIGASIACSGACMTVVEKGSDWFAVDVSAESVACTADGMWEEGQRLNLERSLRVGDELGGHIVTGHVDGVGQVVAVEAVAGSHRVDIRVPRTIGMFLASKGSVAVNGASLTVNDVVDNDDGTTFSLNIIPHSWQVTTFAELQTGNRVNVEIDTLARYVQRLRDIVM